MPNVLPRGDEGTNSNQEPPGQQSRVVTTIILPLFYGISRISAWIPVEIPCQIKSFDTDLKFAVYGTMTEIILIVCSMWSSMIRIYKFNYFLSPRRLLTVAPRKIITNFWLAHTVFDALMHYGIASKLAHVLFFDACVKSHAFLRMRSERSYWITCVAFIFVDACVNRMRLFAAKKSQRILSECTLNDVMARFILHGPGKTVRLFWLQEW